MYRRFEAPCCLNLHNDSQTSCLTTRLYSVTTQTAGNFFLPGIHVTLFYIKNQLHVSGNDGSLYQADHKNIKSKYLQLRWWLEVSDLKHVEFHNVKYAASGKVVHDVYKVVKLHNAWSLNNCKCVLNMLQY